MGGEGCVLLVAMLEISKHVGTVECHYFIIILYITERAKEKEKIPSNKLALVLNCTLGHMYEDFQRTNISNARGSVQVRLQLNRHVQKREQSTLWEWSEPRKI